MSETGKTTRYMYVKRLANTYYKGSIKEALKTAIYREFKRYQEEEHGTRTKHRIQEHKGVKTL